MLINQEIGETRREAWNGAWHPILHKFPVGDVVVGLLLSPLPPFLPWSLSRATTGRLGACRTHECRRGRVALGSFRMASAYHIRTPKRVGNPQRFWRWLRLCHVIWFQQQHFNIADLVPFSSKEDGYTDVGRTDTQRLDTRLDGRTFLLWFFFFFGSCFVSPIRAICS